MRKDGSWNTLCLPFSVEDGDDNDALTFSGTPLQGAIVKSFDKAYLYGSTLTLEFTDNLNEIKAGKPYIVKWTKPDDYVPYDGSNAETCSDIVNPFFYDVTITKTATSYENGFGAIFYGLYSPYRTYGKEWTVLYLGADNTLYYPSGDMTIGAFRAYFYAVSQWGDLNGDDSVNVTDVTLMVNHILGKDNDNFIIENADVNNDGDINVTDVTALVNIILKGGNGTQNVVINSADGFTFGGRGNGAARAKNN